MTDRDDAARATGADDEAETTASEDVPVTAGPEGVPVTAAPEEVPATAAAPAAPADPAAPAAPADPAAPSTTRAIPDATIASDDDVVVDRANRVPLTRRRLALLGARSAGAIVAVAIAVVAIGGATLVPGPRFGIEPPSTVVTPVPAAQQRLCPGPLLRLGDESGQGATSASSVGQATSEFQADPDAAVASPITTTENVAGVAPVLITLPPQGDTTADPLLAGSQSQTVRSGDLVGFAAAECDEPSGDAWLVGGAADVGRTTLITISNPTTVIATVDLTIYSETGPVAAPGAEGIVVPPDSQRIFALAGFAPGIVRPVVRVESRGGQIVADLQQSVVRTLAPGGVEIVAATVGPARRTVIPGVIVSGGGAVEAARAQDGYDDLGAALRLLAPGDTPGAATITIVRQADAAAAAAPDPAAPAPTDPAPTAPAPTDLAPADPAADPRQTADSATFTVPLVGGEVTEVPLTGLVDGAYVVTVEATTPMVAGVRSSVLTTDGAADLVWLSGAPALPETTLVSIAPGPRSVLRLANDTADDLPATISAFSGDVSVTVPAGGSTGVPVDAGSDVTIVAEREGLRATVTYVGPDGISAFAVTPPGPASTPVLVYR